MIAYAATEGAHIVKSKELLGKIESAILFPIMTLMMTVALFVFLYGMYEYVLHAENDEARSAGKQHMLYGIIGLVIMVSAYAILRIAASTFGVEIPS